MRRFLQHLSGEGLKARALRGTLMTGMGFGGQNLLRLAGNLVLTRLLFPEAFGLMALIQVAITGLNMFSDIGIRTSIIQDARGTDPTFLNTAWTIQIGRGTVLWLATWALAAPLAEFYEAPLLAQMLPVAGLTALFQGFNSTKMATASRAIRLERMMFLGLVTQAIGLVVMISLAYLWGTVWALVIGGLVAPLLTALLSHFVLEGASNRLAFEPAAARQLVGFGKYIFLATIAGFLTAQADRAILGKVVTLEQLALYNIAFFLASVPHLLIRKLADSILFPLYRERPPSGNAASRVQIARARGLLLTATLGMSAMFALLGSSIITLLYDPRYEAAGPLLVLISLGQMPLLIIAGYGPLALAAGESRRFAVIAITSAVLRTSALLAGALWFGIVGVALAPAVAGVVFYPLLIAMTRRYQGWTPRLDLLFFFFFCGLAALAITLDPAARLLVAAAF